MIRPMRAGEMRTGDRLVTGAVSRLITQVARAGGDVVLTHPAGRTQVAADALVRVDRHSRVDDLDAPALVYRAG